LETEKLQRCRRYAAENGHAKNYFFRERLTNELGKRIIQSPMQIIGIPIRIGVRITPTTQTRSPKPKATFFSRSETGSFRLGEGVGVFWGLVWKSEVGGSEYLGGGAETFSILEARMRFSIFKSGKLRL
jgi:hypothetical protein